MSSTPEKENAVSSSMVSTLSTLSNNSSKTESPTVSGSGQPTPSSDDVAECLRPRISLRVSTPQERQERELASLQRLHNALATTGRIMYQQQTHEYGRERYIDSILSGTVNFILDKEADNSALEKLVADVTAGRLTLDQVEMTPPRLTRRTWYGRRAWAVLGEVMQGATGFRSLSSLMAMEYAESYVTRLSERCRELTQELWEVSDGHMRLRKPRPGAQQPNILTLEIDTTDSKETVSIESTGTEPQKPALKGPPMSLNEWVAKQAEKVSKCPSPQ
ncbi:MAG: hypothetical protein M1833_005935 [Piccolia ochrophora]|nr:MAG: hypothetical protein M1833_005935 [Piccolia ochrophora]